MFHVGQKVVCVNDDWSNHHPYWVDHMPNKPKRGRLYHVREIMPPFLPDGECGLRLNEVINPLVCWGPHYPSFEGAFLASLFRPVAERKTDISVFEEIRKRASKELETVDD